MEILYEGTTEELSELPLAPPISTDSVSNRVESEASYIELQDREPKNPKKQKSAVKPQPLKSAVKENMLENILMTATSTLNNLNSQTSPSPSANHLFGQ